MHRLDNIIDLLLMLACSLLPLLATVKMTTMPMELTIESSMRAYVEMFDIMIRWTITMPLQKFRHLARATKYLLSSCDPVRSRGPDTMLGEGQIGFRFSVSTISNV